MPETMDTHAQSMDPSSQETAPTQSISEASPAPQLTELEKLEKFKFEGQELTPAELKKAILRQKDYTQKTTSLSEERKAFDSDKKFYVNLWADLRKVSENPGLASEFIKVYPQSFHQYLKAVLENSNRETQEGGKSQSLSQPDIDTLSRIQRLESTLHDQEVAKSTASLNASIDKFSKKYPDALPELAIGAVFEAFNRGEKVTDELWETSFKASEEKIKNLVSQRYGDLVKKQTTANAKARDVDSGGGTPGRAPKKFGSIAEVTKFAASQLSEKP